MKKTEEAITVQRLYLISQDVNVCNSAFSSAIVAAKSEEEARKIHPASNDYKEIGDDEWRCWGWCDRPDQVHVRLVGIACKGVLENDVLCASSYRIG